MFLSRAASCGASNADINSSKKDWQRESMKGAGKLHEHCYFECNIATIDDPQYSSCGNCVEVKLLSSASTRQLSPPSSHGSLHACSFCRLTWLHNPKQANSSFLPNICAKNLSKIAKRADGKVYPWLEAYCE